MVSSGDDYHGICMKMLEQLPWFEMIDERNINDNLIVIEIFINEIFHRAMFSYDRQLAAAIFENAVNLMEKIWWHHIFQFYIVVVVIVVVVLVIQRKSFSSFIWAALYLICVLLFMRVYVNIKTWTFRIINVIFAFILFYIVLSIHIAHIYTLYIETHAYSHTVVSIRCTVPWR